ncbi:hypothetical protein [Halorussus amylolyticus]|uniref:hypothetical protein n=1 Tax=Halorussus amylolyticus TaxID=1126242 RepID=UPI00138EE250|nr:hypothetical protein [Halorussus amylolyticus]
MTLRELVSAHLPNAVVAAIIFALYDIYTGDIADPLAIGVDFILYLVAIFVGFVVITPILDRLFDDGTA